MDKVKTKRWREANAEYQTQYMRTYHQIRKATDPNYRVYNNEREMVRKYGLTMAEFEAMLASQGGVCAICGGPPNGPGKRYHVDHCHDTKKVRGLLCGKCNTAIGLLNHDPARLRAAAKYLKR